MAGEEQVDYPAGMDQGSGLEKVSSEPCLFCSMQFSDPTELDLHLKEEHHKNCFQCGICFPSTQIFIFYSDILTHFLEKHGVLKPDQPYQLFIPRTLELVTCSFCSPSRYFLGKGFDDLMVEVYEHLDTLHADKYANIESVLELGVTHFCRLCVNQPFSRVELEHHTGIHYRGTRGNRTDSHSGYSGYRKELVKVSRKTSSREMSEDAYSGQRKKIKGTETFRYYTYI